MYVLIINQYSQSFLITQINDLSVLSEMSNRELKTQKSVGWTELGQEFIDACYQGDEAEVGNLLTIAGAKKRDFNTQDQYRKGVMKLSTENLKWKKYIRQSENANGSPLEPLWGSKKLKVSTKRTL